MKIVLVNVRYSANLGDGVIAECLEHGLNERLPGVDVINCDLAGRTGFGDAGGGALRSIALSILPMTPASVKKSVYARLFEVMVRGKLLPHYDESINGANLAIFGGGQILADADLNFPMKIAAAASIIRERNVPIAIHAVGVGADWSEKGAELFKEAFVGADIIWASVRDRLSQQRWERHFAGADISAPKISFDPGLIAAKAYASAADDEAPRRNRPLIGLCVTNPATLTTHLDAAGDAEAPDIAFYRECARTLCDDAFDVLAFTNGAPDDEAFLRRCFPDRLLRSYDDDQLRVADTSRTPGDLVDIIRQCDAVASHRLHACIVAYSYRIPNVGMTLNRKLDSFFDAVDRRDFLVGPNAVKPADVANAVRRAIETPIDIDRHASIIQRTEDDFDALAAVLKEKNHRQSQRIGAPGF